MRIRVMQTYPDFMQTYPDFMQKYPLFMQKYPDGCPELSCSVTFSILRSNFTLKLF